VKLTHILTGKNDNYAGFFEERLYLTMKYNLHLYKKLGIDVEFLFVEWNPLQDKELLSTKLAQQFKDYDFKAYVIQPDIHDKVVGKYAYMTFLEFFAKNVGIKRASGDYILCSNADIFLSEKVMSNFVNNLSERTIFRAQRFDIDFDKLTALTEDEYRSAIVRPHEFPLHDKIYVDASGDFTLAHKNLWLETNGYDENQRFVKVHKDSRFLYSANELGDVEFVNLGEIYHIDHGTSVPNTGLDPSKYRQANGPYGWAFMKNLPYQNHDNWGLDSKYFGTKRIGENIFQLTVQDDQGLIYPNDDSEYMTEEFRQISKKGDE
jgi:hypothetical protein